MDSGGEPAPNSLSHVRNMGILHSWYRVDGEDKFPYQSILWLPWMWLCIWVSVMRSLTQVHYMGVSYSRYHAETRCETSPNQSSSAPSSPYHGYSQPGGLAQELSKMKTCQEIASEVHHLIALWRLYRRLKKNNQYWWRFWFRWPRQMNGMVDIILNILANSFLWHEHLSVVYDMWSVLSVHLSVGQNKHHTADCSLS